MAGQVGSTVNDPVSPHLISGAFVQQYYHILHEQPEQVHKFYKDSSILGRPEPNGTIESITTQAAINESIMSMDFRNCLIEIETADAQISHKGGVLIVVTGSLTQSEGICRKFTQSFFLAPQESGGYFVLNDVLRFIPARQPAETNQVVTRENESNLIAISASETCSAIPEPTAAETNLNSDHVTVENNVTKRQVVNPPVNGTAVECNIATKPPVQVAKEDPKRTLVASALPPAPTNRDVTKKSYASIVKDIKEGPPAVTVARTTPSVPGQKHPKHVTKDIEVPVKSSAKPAQDNETTASDGIGSENNSLRNEHGYSIFVRNLPPYANIALVEVEFGKFGAVKPDGVQVVHHQFDGFCFGFVEYESQQSMQAAIEASPIRIGDNKVFVEKKKAPTRVMRSVVHHRGDSGEGVRFQAGRGVHRGDNFAGQGGGYANNANYRGGDHFNHRNEGRENYNRRNDGGENYNRRNDGGENYNRRNDGRENFNCMNGGGKNYNCRGIGSENNRRGSNIGENYSRRNDGGENYSRRNDGGENYNSRGDNAENSNRRANMGENYNRRNDGGENYNCRIDGGENYNRRNDGGENYNHRNDGGENYSRRNDGGENYNRRNDGGENYNRRNDGNRDYNRRNDSENYKRGNDGGEKYSCRTEDGENLNRGNFRNQNEFSGGRGQGPPAGNGYHQKGTGFQPPRSAQNGNGRSGRVNGLKQPPGAA